MKKYIGLIGILCLLVSSVMVHAQRPVKMPKTKPVPRGGALGGSAHFLPRTPVKPPVNTGVARSVASSVLETTTGPRVAQYGQALMKEHTPVKGPTESMSPTLETIDALVSQQGQLQIANQQLNTVGVGGGFGKSVLFGIIGQPEAGNGISITVIKTRYNGQEEIFGVIATHTLPESYYSYEGSLHRSFEVAIKQPDGTKARFPAEVVQISPQSMLDISLVKLDPRLEKTLTPLELSQVPATVKEMLFSYGYADGAEATEDRLVEADSFVSIRTTQNLEGDRRGFCGSPLLDAQGHVKAIHTGTVEGDGPVPDVSYGTHVSFIKPLVEAYHNGGKAMYDVVLEDQTVARLYVDEYISHFKLLDENGTVLTEKDMGKFSQSSLLHAMHSYPNASYLEITSRKAQWLVDNSGDSEWHLLIENRKPDDPTVRVQRYDFKTGSLENL